MINQCYNGNRAKKFVYSEVFKRKVVRDIEEGKYGVYQAMSIYSIGGKMTVYNWLSQYGTKNQDGGNMVSPDEIQNVKDLSKTIKLLVDNHADEYKLIMTGSSSALIKYHFSESLVGRKIVIELFPLSFDEFLRFKEYASLADLIQTDLSDILQDQYANLEKLSEEYMIFGGYPKVVLTGRVERKQGILSDIISSYILKDVNDLFKVEKTNELNHLVKYLAVNIGKEISVNSLSAEIGLPHDTLKQYINILEECYIIKRIEPFHKSLSTELKRTPKVYFVDPGVRIFWLTL